MSLLDRATISAALQALNERLAARGRRAELFLGSAVLRAGRDLAEGLVFVDADLGRQTEDPLGDDIA